MPASASRLKRVKNGSAQQPGFVGSISRFWHRSYAGDYVVILLLMTGYILTETVTEPFHRMFSLDDLAIQFPHAEVERVPVRYNILYSCVIPLLLILISTTLLSPSPTPSRFHKAHITILGLAISLLLTSFLTNIFKNAIGRPRPDLLARCKPVRGTQSHKLVTIEVCTEKDHHKLHDGWRSFPSGHSSFASSGLGFLSLFLAGQLHVFRPYTDFLRALVSLVPLICAAMIAISRWEDYRHDVYDVSAGCLLGLLIANFSYRRYYPSLLSRRCDMPYPSRADAGAAESRRAKEMDEEERIGDIDDADNDDENEHVPLRKGSTERGRRRSSAQ